MFERAYLWGEYEEYFTSFCHSESKSRPAKRIKKVRVEKPAPQAKEIVMLDMAGVLELREHFKMFDPMPKVKPVNHDPHGRYARQDAPRGTENMKPGEMDTWNRFLANLHERRPNTTGQTSATGQI